MPVLIQYWAEADIFMIVSYLLSRSGPGQFINAFQSHQAAGFIANNDLASRLSHFDLNGNCHHQALVQVLSIV